MYLVKANTKDCEEESLAGVDSRKVLSLALLSLGLGRGAPPGKANWAYNDLGI